MAYELYLNESTFKKQKGRAERSGRNPSSKLKALNLNLSSTTKNQN
jgi:hypothetical protein